MDQMATLLRLFDEFKGRVNRSPSQKKAAVLKKAIGHLEKLLKSLQPTQKEIKQELLTNRTAMMIREIWNTNKGLFNLPEMAKELSLKVKRPSIDHIIIGYYFPHDRLEQLAHRFEKIAQSDPSSEQRRVFQEWRVRLRTRMSQEEIQAELLDLVEAKGVDPVRKFAEFLTTKDLTGNRKLSKTASASRLVEALVIRLWREKMTSRAQEGL